MAPSDDRPVAAIFRAPLFNASETFVQAHATGLRRYRAVVVGVQDKGNARSELRPSLIVEPEGLRLKLLGSAPRLLRRLREVRPALVHAHFATDGLLALPLAEALGVPLVTTLHGFDVTRSRAALLRSGRPGWMRYALLGGRLRARGALFVAVSDAIRRRALASGFPAERTVTLLNGVDLARFQAGTPEPGLVLHVGRLVEKKGTALLLSAFAEVARRRPEARLVIVGDGPLRRRLERQAGERVTFAGALPPDEVGRWMGRAWLLAAPSVTAADGDSEGLPTVAVEAAAASLPVVASDHSGLPEAVVDGETGFVVPEGDAAALAGRIEALLAAPDLRAGMAVAARRMAEERFDSVRQIGALEALYDRITGRCG